jgi:hypothetical protein
MAVSRMDGESVVEVRIEPRKEFLLIVLGTMLEQWHKRDCEGKYRA